MNTTSICRYLLSMLSLTCVLAAFPARGEDDVAEQPANSSQEERACKEAITELESSEGAYAEDLSESL